MEPNHPLPENARQSKLGKKRYWLLGVLVLLVVVIFFATRNRPRKDPDANLGQAQTPNIRVATVHRGDIGQYIEALGTVTPVATVNVYSQVNGQVTAVHYVEGQIVHRGDPLIDIDPRPYEAQLQEYEGQLERDQAVLKQAEIDLARYKEASAIDAIARQTYEDQVQTVAQDRGTVKNDMGQVEYEKVQLSYCHLTAPISGRVGLRLVDPGNTIFSGGSSPIVVLTQLQPITVVFNVSEDFLGQVRSEVTHRGTLTVDAYDRSRLSRIGTGKLLTLDNQVDTSTGTIRFRGQFDNADLGMFPNQFVNARLLVRTLRNQVLVPTAAVQHNGTQAFVYVVREGSVHIAPVTEIATEGETAAVTGLGDQETVAITGFDKIQDGTHIAVLGSQASSNQPLTATGAGAL